MQKAGPRGERLDYGLGRRCGASPIERRPLRVQERWCGLAIERRPLRVPGEVVWACYREETPSGVQGRWFGLANERRPLRVPGEMVWACYREETAPPSGNLRFNL